MCAPEDERRSRDRHFACFPATLNRPDGETRTALIQDLSVKGVSIAVRTRLDVDDRISLELSFDVDPASEKRVAHGRVVRITRLGPEATGPWTYKVAVEFDEPLTDIEAQVRALAERQRSLGLIP